jgi:hypothetical protein
LKLKVTQVENEKLDYADPDHLVKVGALNVLALGYKGVELWRKKRTPIDINKDKKNDEEA